MPVPDKKTILVFRLSSMGDVLLTVPVLRALLQENEGIKVLLVTNSRYSGYFSGIERLEIIRFYPDERHHGVAGLLRLFTDLLSYRPHCIADLHSSLRTRILDILFQFRGTPVFRVCKHRLLRRRVLKGLHPGITVPSATDRYAAVFTKAGYRLSTITAGFGGPALSHRLGNSSTAPIRIGIAPLSRHTPKNWGLGKAGSLITQLVGDLKAEVHLFGGPDDFAALEALSGPTVFNHAGQLDAANEIGLISTLNAFVSMDSANMHLAAIAGIPVVSVWGATDPSLGFPPLFQPADRALSSLQSEVPCRPCSVYGERPCHRIDDPMICMKKISPEAVYSKILKIVHAAGG
jgi:ADP-heptose:LPS heptosyltransferase